MAVTIIDEPGNCYIVNNEPRPGLFRSWKVVCRGDRYGVFFTENEPTAGSWTQKIMPGLFDSVDEAKSHLHELLHGMVKKSELIEAGILQEGGA